MFRQLRVAGLLACGDGAQDAAPLSEVRLVPGRERRASTGDQFLRGTLLKVEGHPERGTGQAFLYTQPMSTLPACPKCSSELTYEDPNGLLVCPECAHEWSPGAGAAAEPAEAGPVVKDAVGNVLKDGDTVTVIKDLKVKGASSALKAGTKVKNIRLVDGDHDIDCRIDGFGQMGLKSEFVKKV